MMSYEVRVRELPPMKAMTIRYVTNMQNISSDMGKAYRELWDYMEGKGAQAAGDCFALYHAESAEDFDPDNIDVECGFSVAELIPDGGRVKGRVAEGGLFASVTHRGSYDTLSAAYCAITKWAPENGYELLAGWRDYYLNDPSALPPEEWLTEVVCPVKKIR